MFNLLKNRQHTPVTAQLTPVITRHTELAPAVLQQNQQAQQQLLSLLVQHRQTDGWIVLIAPPLKLNKALSTAYQLPSEKVLVIHAKQLTSAARTIAQALHSNACQVVIHGCHLSAKENAQLQRLAANNNKTFYALPITAAHCH